MTPVLDVLQEARDAAAAARRTLIDLEVDTILNALREADPADCQVYFWAQHPRAIGLYATSAPAYGVRIGEPWQSTFDRPLLHRSLSDVELRYVGDGNYISGGSSAHGACVLFSVIDSRSSSRRAGPGSPLGVGADGARGHGAGPRHR